MSVDLGENISECMKKIIYSINYLPYDSFK